MWKRVGSILRFGYDDTGAYALDSTCFATGGHMKYLCSVLNSKMGIYMLQDAPKTGTGDLLISVQAVEPIRIPLPKEEADMECTDEQIYALYNLTPDIKSQQNQ